MKLGAENVPKLSQKSIFIEELRENGSISGQIMKCTIFLSMCSSMGMQSWFSQEVFGSVKKKIWWFQVPNDDNKMMIFELTRSFSRWETGTPLLPCTTSSKKPKVMHQINVSSFFRSYTSWFSKLPRFYRQQIGSEHVILEPNFPK